jgi:hypothetical protein
MTDLTELANQLRATGIPANKRADLLTAIRAEVASEILEANSAPTPSDRVKYLAIHACRRLGVDVDRRGITPFAFNEAVSKSASLSTRMEAKALLHYSGLLLDD